MKIVVISDIHDNQVNLIKCLKWIKKNKVDKLICLGDITNSETLKFLASIFKKDIFLVSGNVELYHEEELEQYKNIKYFGRMGSFELNGKKISICHEPHLVDKILKKNNHPQPLLEKEGGVDIIFYGHTHRPWIEKRNGVLVVNPGTVGGVFSSPTFAVWDTGEDEPELKLLNELK